LDPEERLKMIQKSRGGGSINPAVMNEMKIYLDAGKLEICEDTEIWSADWKVSYTSCLFIVNLTGVTRLKFPNSNIYF